MAGAVAAQNLHFHDGSRSNKETVDDLATKVDDDELMLNVLRCHETY